MNEPVSCEWIQDLMTLCAEHRASRASIRLVTEHVRECPACRRRFEALRLGKPVPRHFFRFHMPEQKDTERRYFLWSLFGIDALVLLVCMVVNFAVDMRLSWSWIVAGAMACSAIPVCVYLYSRTKRFIKAMLCLSVLSLFLLGLIQTVLFGLEQEGIWIWRVAVPLAGIWLTVFWTGILVSKWKRLNGFFCLCLILALCIPADLATEGVAVAYTGEEFTVHWVNELCYLSGAVASGCMGALFELRSRKRNG